MRRARRVHPCCNRAEFTPAFEAGCSTAASGRCMSCVVRHTGRCPLRASLLIKGRMVRTVPRSCGSGLAALIADFCNKICHKRTHAPQQTRTAGDLGYASYAPMGIECSEELDPCPECEPVGHHIRKVAGVHG